MKTRAIILDIDGVVNHAERFSIRYCKEFNLSSEEMTQFFLGPFQKCLIGESDLKVELSKVLPSWHWNKSVDELLSYWFDGEIHPSPEMLKIIRSVRDTGIPVYGATDQEKYRTAYLEQALHLDTLFEKVFSSCNVGMSKALPSFFQHVLDVTKSPADEVLFWDDDPKNVQSAKSVGITAYVYSGVNSFQKELGENMINISH